MSRAEKIAAILERRAGHAKSLTEVDAHLAAVTEALAHLDDSRLELLGRIDEDARQRLFDIGQNIRELDDGIKRQRADIGQLMTRLNRPTLNVGMVGRARMGKSRFLQSLTGLTARQIPDGNRGFCTGVASLIRHVPGARTSADVYLHNEGSFLADVIGPYYRKLGLGSLPTAARDFAASALPALLADEPRAKSAYAHLEAYHRNFPAFGDLLLRPSPVNVGDEQIRGYVAQDDEAGSKEYHAFRAVRRVEIETEFAAADVAGLAVVDLPGLGDTNLGDSRTLLAALRDDVDVVLFVREPAPRGDDIQDFDVDLYTMAKEALPEIPMGLRSFLIINHRRSADQDNLDNARRYQAKVSGSAIKVVSSPIVDCSKPDEVAAAFEPIVDYLLEHADELDDVLLGECRARTAAVTARLGELVKQAGLLAVLAQPSSVWFRDFLKLFNRAYNQLSASLEQIVKQMEVDRDNPDNEFAQAVGAVVEQAARDDGIPSVAEIDARISLTGAKFNAYGELLTEARAHLSRHFLALDGAIKARVAEMQEKVAAALATEGELRPLSNFTGRDFLLALADRIQPARTTVDQECEIKFALTMLADFELAYRGFIQHHVRPCLDGMHPDHPMIPVEGNFETISAQTIRDTLEVTYKDSLRDCHSALKGILAEPSSALFAIVEEFKERVLRAADSEDEWRAFYMDVRAEVWAGPLGALAERSGQFRSWNQNVDDLRACLRTAPHQPAAGPEQPAAAGTDEPGDKDEGEWHGWRAR
jgi:hypothetical protein